MAIITVTGAAQFTAALSSARAGDTLRLNPGDYGALNLDGDRTPALKFAGDVTVTSAIRRRPGGGSPTSPSGRSTTSTSRTSTSPARAPPAATW